MVYAMKTIMKYQTKDYVQQLPTYFDDKPFYTSERYFDGEERQPVRPGMLLTLTSGLCFLLAGIGFITSSTKKPNYDVTKYAIGIVALIIALTSFFIVGMMCVKHFIQMRERRERLVSIITRHAYADQELLEISTQHIEEQFSRNLEKSKKPKFLPTTISIVSEEPLYNNKHKQIIKTLS